MVGREGKMRRIKKKNRSILSAISLIFKLIVMVALLCLISIAAFWVSETGQRFRKSIHQTYTYMINKTHLTLKNVSIEGHYRTTAEEVNEVLNLVQGMDILGIDLAVVQNQIAELPWVDSVSVERHLPDTVYIRITEKKPIAIWQHNKTYFPLDETG
ncbi:MAG: FtsQ-type POTRA domain-containing protein, partial [Alphaproteobacteria bacterium]|nr:FtsQ-type POTRA domain-containing protein [Alphaproteobacteria bacterium]